jgi:hypothetical protein
MLPAGNFENRLKMKTMTLDEMVDFCRRCHRLAPFTNYNGNTFAAHRASTD